MEGSGRSSNTDSSQALSWNLALSFSIIDFFFYGTIEKQLNNPPKDYLSRKIWQFSKSKLNFPVYCLHQAWRNKCRAAAQSASCLTLSDCADWKCCHSHANVHPCFCTYRQMWVACVCESRVVSLLCLCVSTSVYGCALAQWLMWPDTSFLCAR